MSAREEVRNMLMHAIKQIDSNEGFGAIIVTLSGAIMSMAAIYKMPKLMKDAMETGEPWSVAERDQ